MKKLISIIYLISLTSFIYAQSISGIIKDEEGNTIEFATVILQSIDSTYTNVMYTDSIGRFKFEKDLSPFRLTIQHLMYKTLQQEFKSKNIGEIILQNKDFELGEIVVKGEVPVMKLMNGKMTYNIAQLSKNTTASSAYDAILKLPAVYEKDDQINLAGTNGVNIIINGKPSTMSYEQLEMMLKNMPKDRLLSAEVMYSTPPQYNVRGASINLILDNKFSETPNFQGQINANVGQSFYTQAQSGVSLLYTTPKSSTDFMYSFDYKKVKSGQDVYSSHLFDSKIYDIYQHNQGVSSRPTHNIRIGNTFNIDDSNKINTSYTAEIEPWRHSTQSSRGTLGEATNNKTLDTPIQMHNLSLDYTSGFGLRVGTNYTYYKSHTNQNFKSEASSFVSKSKQDINKISLYADQTNSLAKDWDLNYGFKYSFASDHSEQTYKSLNTNYNNSDSELNEYTYDLYGGFSKKFSDKVSLNASVMGEYYKHKDKSYWSIFPQLELTYMINAQNILQASLSSDKDYPSYWEMTNSISYLDAYTQIQGNPNLRPSKYYELNLNYIYKNKYNFTLYSNYTDDYFAQLPYQSNKELALIYKTTNFNYKKITGISITAPFKIGSFISSNAMLNIAYHQEKNNKFHDLSFKNDLVAVFAMLNNTFNFSKNVKGELNGIYTPKNIQGPATLTSMYKIDAGIKWQSNDENCEIRLKAQDIFNKWSPKMMKTHFDNQNIDMHIIPDSRLVSLSFTYKFGGYKAKSQNQVDTSRFGSK